MPDQALCSVLAITVVFSLVGAPASAQNLQCPKAIAYLDGEQSSAVVKTAIEKIYLSLGCNTQFVPYPGRRGIAYFNSGNVDGELMRNTSIESHYAKPFCKSERPLFSMVSSLWQHTDSAKANNLPTGYLLGVIWQEEYAKGKNALALNSADRMYSAYNTGYIGSFFASDFDVSIAIKTGRLSPAPLKVKEVHRQEVFHYLNQSHCDFANQFSDYLNNNPIKIDMR